MNNWGANHGAISYGHIGADLITLAAMLRIPVCMHNVPKDQIFLLVPGLLLAWMLKDRTIVPARHTVLCTNKFQL